MRRLLVPLACAALFSVPVLAATGDAPTSARPAEPPIPNARIAAAGASASAVSGLTLSAAIETALGPIESSTLGFTLAHEHVAASGGEDLQHYPFLFDRAASIAAIGETMRRWKMITSTTTSAPAPPSGRPFFRMMTTGRMSNPTRSSKIAPTAERHASKTCGWPSSAHTRSVSC